MQVEPGNGSFSDSSDHASGRHSVFDSLPVTHSAMPESARKFPALARAWPPRRGRLADAISEVAANPQAPVVRFGYIGRIDPDKNLRMLIEAFAQAQRHLPNVELIVRGNSTVRDDYLDELRALVAQEGLDDVVKFEGPYEPHELAEILGKLDVMVTVSRKEVGPLTVMEALMSGTPVVATDVGTVRENAIGPNGPAGIVIPVGEPEQLTRRVVTALTYLAVSARARSQMGVQARRYATSKFSAAKTADPHIALFNDLLRDKKDACRVEIGGYPYFLDGVQMFIRQLARGIRGKLPGVSIDLVTFVTDPNIEPKTNLVEGFDNVWVTDADPNSWSDTAPRDKVETIFVPAMRTLLEATARLDLGKDFSESSEGPLGAKPSTLELEQVTDALVSIRNFFHAHHTFDSALDSVGVRQLYRRTFPKLHESEVNALQDRIKRNIWPLLEKGPESEADIIYTPSVGFGTLSSLTRSRRSNTRLVLGFHTFQLRNKFLALHHDPDASLKVRRLEQKFTGLVGYVLFEGADKVVHYGPESGKWSETYYGAQPSKSVRVKVGIEDFMPTN